MSGDGVAEEDPMGRVDLISLILLVSAILLLSGMTLAIPAKPIEFTSICRSRVDDVATKAKVVPAPPAAVRVEIRPES
jgi:hypothetical protein